MISVKNTIMKEKARKISLEIFLAFYCLPHLLLFCDFDHNGAFDSFAE